MNEFTQLLLLIWKIVVFFLDLASYLICTVAVIIACALPWRAVAILKNVHDLDRGDCLRNFFRTVWESLCLLVCLPSLIVPSRLIGFVGLFTESQYRKELFGCQGCPEYTVWFLMSPFMGIMEVVAYSMGFLALLSIVRSHQTYHEARAASRKAGNWNMASFNLELLTVLAKNCMTMLLDIIFLPMLVALILTVYRGSFVIRQLKKGFGWKTRAMILEQFMRLLIDVFLAAPSLLLVTVTGYRLPPLYRRMRAMMSVHNYQSLDVVVSNAGNDVGKWDTVKSECCSFTRMQLLPIRSAGLILLDLLCSPLILLLIVTFYRFRTITLDLEGIRFHKAVVKETFELIVDTPFVLAGVLVTCTLYRADLVLRACMNDAQTAWERRRTVGEQFLRLLGDIMSLVPLLIVVCTLYRLCSFALNIKAQLVQLLREDPDMRLLSWQLSLPRPKGKPCFIVNAAKSPNLHGVTSMQLQVVGEEFWTAVAQARGGLVAAAGRAILPLALRHGKEVDFAIIEHGRSEVTLRIEFDFNVKHRAVERFLQVLPGDVEVLLQLEAGLAEGGRKIVLLSTPCKIADLLAAITLESFRFEAPVEEGETIADRLAVLRGTPGHRRDAWLPIVVAECSQVLLDTVHVCLAFALLAVPWRFIEAVTCFLQPTPLRYAQRACRALVALEGWFRTCSTVLTRTELLCNRYAKATAEASGVRASSGNWSRCNPSRRRGNIETNAENCVGGLCCIFCPCCPNYNDWDHEDWEVVRYQGHQRYYSSIHRLAEEFDDKLKSICAPLRFYRTQLRGARKAWPDDSEWSHLRDDIDTFIQRRSAAFFWILFLHEVHVLVTSCRITKDEHSRVAQAIRNRALPAVQGAEPEFHHLWSCFEAQRNVAAAGSYGCKNKSKGLLYAILREQFARAITDLIAIPVILLLILTVYRLPHIRKEMGKSMEHLKMAIKVEGLQLAMDFGRLLQLFLLTVLLIVTIVKLPDYLSTLRPSHGLRKMRDCALAAASELIVGIGELLLLITAWKTYRLLVSAIVFSVLCPAAMLAMTLPAAFTCTRCRLMVASLLWLAIILASMWAPAPYMLFSVYFVLVLAFCGFCLNKVPGWMRPRGGMDWWSSVCRVTLPNLLSLTAIAGEALVLALVGGSGLRGHQILYAGSEGMDTFAVCAVSVVALAILLETLPMVCDEKEQVAVITAHIWRAATMIIKEVLFFPVVLVLIARISEHWLYCVSMLFYSAIALLSSAIWDVDLSYESLLDVRCSGLNSSGRRLLAVAGIQAELAGHHVLFLLCMAVSAAWTAMWAHFASSIRWAEVLRVGAYAGALAAAMSGLFHVRLVWMIASALAVCVAGSGWVSRKHALKASAIPSSVQHCVDIERSLRLWGDTAAPQLRVDADVRSTARRVLEFEDWLPVERLDLDFFVQRQAWRTGLAEAPDYETVLLHIEKLKVAICVPVTRILVQQVLAQMPLNRSRLLDLPLAKQVAEFVVPPIDFELPPPLRGWEFGDLDLAALRRHAAQQAAKIPKLIQTDAMGPDVIGRRAFASAV